MDREARQQLADEFEKVRAPGLLIAEAAARFKVRSTDLEGALWRTEPDTDRAHGVNFNADLADRELDTAAEDWRAARDSLRQELEAEAERFLFPLPPELTPAQVEKLRDQFEAPYT